MICIVVPPNQAYVFCGDLVLHRQNCLKEGVPDRRGLIVMRGEAQKPIN